MIHINKSSDLIDLLEAAKGDYYDFTLGNGIIGIVQGRLLHFNGCFDGTQNVIEIPKINYRIPVLFTGENFSCMSLAEPNAGFVKVPDIAKQKKFVVFSTITLNSI